MARTPIAALAAALLLAGLTAAKPAPADALEDEEPQESTEPSGGSAPAATLPPTEGEKPAATDLAVPVFAPPRRDAPKARLGGATRGPAEPDLSGIEALVPEEAGWTLEEQPVLYWYVPRSANGRATLTVTSSKAERPLLKAAIESPLRAGVQRIRLADHGLRLERGAAYQWIVTFLPDPDRPSRARTIGGGIERIDPPDALRGALAAARPERVPFLLAEAGIWYDALDALSQRIDAAPEDARIREQRASLLEQVGLREIARAERSAARTARQ